MPTSKPILVALLSALLLPGLAGQATPDQTRDKTTGYQSPYARWENGPPKRPDYFPIAVWLQDPRHAARYKRAGINLYVGLWQGPTEQHLADLTKASMPVFCDQNEVALKSPNRAIITGWIRGDEPDNAQRAASGGFGPPVPPADVVRHFGDLVGKDKTRPVLLNLGQGVAWDMWKGRGVRTNHPEDYVHYVKGADIVSFDIYPVVHKDPAVAGNLWYVPRGVARLVQWTGGKKPVWNCIEASRIHSTTVKPTAAQIRSEVWMSIIHGSRGLIYFVHQFKPKFHASSLLADAKLLAGVTAINKQVTELAAVINSPSVEGAVVVESSHAEVPIAITVRRHDQHLYVFAVAMRPGEADATFRLTSTRSIAEGSVEVLGEDRKLAMKDGRFTQSFADYGVHLFRVGLK